MTTQTLLLPGLICDETIWHHQVKALERRNVRVAHGYRLCRTIEAMAETVLSNAPPMFNLCGHSMGARVALEIYRRAPDRVKKLALLDTGTHTTRSGEKDKRYALWDIGKSKGMEALVDAWLPPMVAPAFRNEAEIMTPLRTMALRAGLDGFEAQMHALLDRPEVESLLPSIDVPTLVGVGSEDVWSPLAQHRQIAALIPNAQIVVFEGAGHMSPAETPHLVTDALSIWMSDHADHR